MRVLILTLSLIICFFSSASVKHGVDIYQLCQVVNDNIKRLTELPKEDLYTLKRKIALAKSVKEFSLVVGKDYTPMIENAQKHQNKSYDEAEKGTLSVLKLIEMHQVSQAIKVYPIKHTKIWDAIFDQCVKDNS